MIRSQIFSHADWHTAAPREHSLPAKGHGQPFSHLPSAGLEVHTAQSCGNGRTGYTSTSADSIISHSPELITARFGPDASEPASETQSQTRGCNACGRAGAGALVAKARWLLPQHPVTPPSSSSLTISSIYKPELGTPSLKLNPIALRHR